MLVGVFGFVKETKRTISYLIWNHVFVFFSFYKTDTENLPDSTAG